MPGNKPKTLVQTINIHQMPHAIQLKIILSFVPINDVIIVLHEVILLDYFIENENSLQPTIDCLSKFSKKNRNFFDQDIMS